jgi:hypothetical protein
MYLSLFMDPGLQYTTAIHTAVAMGGDTLVGMAPARRRIEYAKA